MRARERERKITIESVKYAKVVSFHVVKENRMQFGTITNFVWSANDLFAITVHSSRLNNVWLRLMLIVIEHISVRQLGH